MMSHNWTLRVFERFTSMSDLGTSIHLLTLGKCTLECDTCFEQMLGLDWTVVSRMMWALSSMEGAPPL